MQVYHLKLEMNLKLQKQLDGNIIDLYLSNLTEVLCVTFTCIQGSDLTHRLFASPFQS